MISVNLLPKEERSAERQLVTAPRKQFLLPLALIVAVIVPIAALYLMQITKIHGLKSDIEVAQIESTRLKPQIAKINQLMVKREELNLRLNLVRNLNRARTLPVQLMDELSMQVPEHLWMTTVEHGGGAMTLAGVTFSNLLVADLMSRLERTDLYRDVDLTVAERVKLGEEEVIIFTLTAQVTQ